MAKRVSFEEAKEAERLEKLSFKVKDEKKRITFIDDGTGNAILYEVDYFPFNETLKISFQVTDDEQLNEMIKPIMGNPDYRYVAPVVEYDTDMNGNVVSGNIRVIPFVIPPTKIGIFKSLSQEWGLLQHDILLNCVNPDYTDYTATILRDRQYTPEMDQFVKEKVADPDFEKKIQDAVAYKLKYDKIANTLGIILPPHLQAQVGQQAPQQAGATPAPAGGTAPAPQPAPAQAGGTPQMPQQPAGIAPAPQATPAQQPMQPQVQQPAGAVPQQPQPSQTPPPPLSDDQLSKLVGD